MIMEEVLATTIVHYTTGAELRERNTKLERFEKKGRRNWIELDRIGLEWELRKENAKATKRKLPVKMKIISIDGGDDVIEDSQTND